MTKQKPFIFKNSKGVKYSIRTRKIPKKYDASGLCFPPYGPKPRIYIDKNISDKSRLSVVIEEMAHAFFWERPEKDIRGFASALTKFLYQDNWRKTY